jgi:hypothetical protein
MSHAHGVVCEQLARSAYLALLVVLQEQAGADAAGVLAALVAASEDVLPQLPPNGAVRAVQAAVLRVAALAAVPHEEYPALLPCDVLLEQRLVVLKLLLLLLLLLLVQLRMLR